MMNGTSGFRRQRLVFVLERLMTFTRDLPASARKYSNRVFSSMT